jgi:IclR family acetate operon transcriptional repressor
MTERDVRNAVHDGAAAPTVAAPMVQRAFRLLDLLADAEEGLTLSELARALGMSKGSLHGLLKTLEGEAIVELVGERRYVLGPHLYDLARRDARHAGLRRHALPAMRRLAAAIGETIILGYVERHWVHVVERVEPQANEPRLRVSAECGTRVHLLAGATGRVVLASWPDARREEYLRARPLPHFTEHSITDPARFLAAVAATARTGIGEDHEEYLRGVNAVAAPIRGPDGSLLALLWAVGFSALFDGEALDRAGRLIRAEAEAIARAVRGGRDEDDGTDDGERAHEETKGAKVHEV